MQDISGIKDISINHKQSKEIILEWASNSSDYLIKILNQEKIAQ